MQTSIKVIVSLVLLSSVLASYDSSTKLRRDGVLNLYPFPRVGRASQNTWQLLNDYSLDYEPIEKRQLYAFPRVGRASLALLRDGLMGHLDLKPVPSRRAEKSDSGMWFGPRLGRAIKSDDDDINIQNDNNVHSEPEQMETGHEYRKKRDSYFM